MRLDKKIKRVKFKSKQIILEANQIAMVQANEEAVKNKSQKNSKLKIAINSSEKEKEQTNKT